MSRGACQLTSIRRAIWAGPVIAFALILFGAKAGRAADISSGTGVVIGAQGEVLTNAHVVENCAKITVQSLSASVAYSIARDDKNDLAVVRSSLPASPVAVLRGATRRDNSPGRSPA